MKIEEAEVYITPNGFGRVAIVRRGDGFYSIYKWIKLPARYLPEVFAQSSSVTWDRSGGYQAELYEDMEPLIGIYGSIDDARREVRSLQGFEAATVARRA